MWGQNANREGQGNRQGDDHGDRQETHYRGFKSHEGVVPDQGHGPENFTVNGYLQQYFRKNN
jgi:hypothetical protein